jgi:Zn-finger nucleic acid-binding protein
MTAYRSIQLECPGCGHVMEATRVASQPAHSCPSCLGLWVDAFFRDLPEVAARARSGNEEAPLSGGRASCPRCDEPLAFHAVPGLRVFVHWCAVCRGTFYPRRALDELALLHGE